MRSSHRWISLGLLAGVSVCLHFGAVFAAGEPSFVDPTQVRDSFVMGNARLPGVHGGDMELFPHIFRVSRTEGGTLQTAMFRVVLDREREDKQVSRPFPVTCDWLQARDFELLDSSSGAELPLLNWTRENAGTMTLRVCSYSLSEPIGNLELANGAHKSAEFHLVQCVMKAAGDGSVAFESVPGSAQWEVFAVDVPYGFIPSMLHEADSAKRSAESARTTFRILQEHQCDVVHGWAF